VLSLRLLLVVVIVVVVMLQVVDGFTVDLGLVVRVVVLLGDHLIVLLAIVYLGFVSKGR
jgi:hypothetical protein